MTLPGGRVTEWLEQPAEQDPRVYSVEMQQNFTVPQTPPNPRRVNLVPSDNLRTNTEGELTPVSLGVPPSFSDTRSIVDDRGDSDRLSELQNRTGRKIPRELDARQIELEVSAAGSGLGWLEDVESRIEYDYVPKKRSEAMSEKLVRAMQTSYQGRRFLPLDCLEAIVNEKDVIEGIKHKTRLEANALLTTDQLQSVAKYICQASIMSVGEDRRDRKRTKTSLQKLFALLVLCNKVAYIFKFIRCDYSDYILPLSRRRCEQTEDLSWDLCMERSKDESQKCLDIFKDWELIDVQRFLECQWQVHVPYFAWRPGKPHHYTLNREDVLPWIEEKKEELPPSFIGGFGRVTLVKIHKAHHNLPREPHAEYFAVKTLDDKTDDIERRFKDEVAALRRFTNRDQPHIVMLLATFQWNGLYHFLFPAADGNLEQLWKEFKDGTALKDIGCSWMLTQSLGLAQALSKIHIYTPSDSNARDNLTTQEQESRNGIHGDIKPRNFLWFQTPSNSPVDEGYPGTLKICDFGFTTFHKDETVNAIRQQGGSHTYCAPEGFESTSPRYDIWSIGCVFVEFVTWYLLGYQAVEKFSDQRCEEEESQDTEEYEKFPEDKFYISQSSPEMKQVVREWLRTLHSDESCSDAIHDFLQLIEDHMLVPLDSRCYCSHLVQELSRIVKTCEEKGKAYWATPNPYRLKESPVILPESPTPLKLLTSSINNITNGSIHSSPGGGDGTGELENLVLGEPGPMEPFNETAPHDQKRHDRTDSMSGPDVDANGENKEGVTTTPIEDMDGFMERVTQAVKMVDSLGAHIVILGLLLWLSWGVSRIARLVTAFLRGELVLPGQ